MYIKLSANSNEAINYITNLGNNNCIYTYYYGNNDGSLQKDSWALKLFSIIEKMFFKDHDLAEEQKIITQYINNAVKELNNSFDKENPDYFKDMEISLNINSGFNNWLKNKTGIFYLIIPGLSKIRASLLEDTASINSYTNKISVNLSFFEEKNIKKYPFIEELMKHLSLEETIKLCLYHEVSHSFHYTNIKNKQISWEDGISNFLDIGKDLINKSLWYPNKKPGERFDEKIISGSKEKLSILEFIGDCVILDKEIYADVGSLLLLRNEKINKGDYSSNDMHKYIDAVLLARCEEAHLANFFNDFSKGITDFNHNTVCGLEHLKTMINTLPDKILSPKEINTISDTCSKVGLSRVILVSHLIKENYLDQFKLLLNIKYNEKDKKFFLDYDSNSIKAESLWNNIKHTTGIDWYEKFLDKVSACKNMMTSLESKTIWYAGTNPLGYQSDIEFHNTMVAEIDKKNLVHVNIKDVKANLEKLYYEECEKYHNKKDKALKKKSANNSIQKLRNKFISNSDKTPKLNNT